MEEIKVWKFDPFLGTRSEIETFLASQKAGTAHPFRSQGAKLALIWNGSRVQEVDISTKSENFFINQANLGDIEEIVEEYLSRYYALTHVRGYTMQMLHPGDVFEIDYSEGAIGSFVATNKIDFYFDFVVYFEQNGLLQNVNYGHCEGGGFTHSGDIESLLHTVHYQIPEGREFVLAVVGYNLTPLWKFAKQLPVIFVVNHAQKVINMVPCPLDKATIGDATMSGLVVGKRVGNKLRYSVLSDPLTKQHVNTCEISDSILKLVREAFVQAGTMSSTPPEPKQVPVLAPTIKLESTPKLVQLVEAGLDINLDVVGLQRIGFGSGFSDSQQRAAFNLPHLFGSCSGISACALGTPNQLPNLDPHKFQYPLIHVSEYWLDSSQQACQFMGNGIFMIHAEKKPIEQVNINALAMAGPNSVVLVEQQGQLRFYRGIRVPGLLETLPCFGDVVTEHFTAEKLSAWYSHAKMTGSTVVPLGTTTVTFQGQLLEIEEVLKNILKLNLEQLVQLQDKVIDLLTQISVLLKPAEVTEIRNQIDQRLLELINVETQPLRQAHRDFIMENLYKEKSDQKRSVPGFTKKSKDLHTATRNRERELHKSVQALSNALHNLVSVRGISNQNQNIKRRQRHAAVYSNVSKADQMGVEELSQIIDDACGECGVVMTDVDHDLLPEALKAVSENRFLEWFSSRQLRLANQSPRMGVLNAPTMGSLLEVTEGTSHQLSGSSICVAVPTQLGLSMSAVPFLLLDKHVQMKDPSKVKWPEEANIEQLAMFRIRTRDTIARATCNRSTIAPSSQDLGYFLVALVLNTMEGLAERMTLPDPEKDWNTTNCQVMRGLFGQVLSLMGSGVRCLCTAFQFVGKNPDLEILKPEQVWILKGILFCFPYTCWDDQWLKKNLSKYLIRILRKVVDEAVKPMLKNLSKTEQDMQAEYLKNRNEELSWLAVAVEALFALASDSDLDEVAVKDRLLEVLPKEVRIRAMNPTQGRRGLGKVYEFLTKEFSSANLRDSEEFLKILGVCLGIFTKRSAAFKTVKKELRDAAQTAAWESKLAEYKALVKSVAARSKNPEAKVPVQNQRSIVDHDRKRLGGDAELDRVPWSVTKVVVDWQEQLHYVLTGGQFQIPEPSTSEVVDEKSAVVMAVEGSKFNDQALTLAKGLEGQLEPLLGGYGSMFAAFAPKVGMDDSVARGVLGQYLKGWRHTYAVEQMLFDNL